MWLFYNPWEDLAKQKSEVWKHFSLLFIDYVDLIRLGLELWNIAKLNQNWTLYCKQGLFSTIMGHFSEIHDKEQIGHSVRIRLYSW